MKNFKLLVKRFSKKNGNFAEEIINKVNNIKIDNKVIVDSDFNNNDEQIFEMSDIEDVIMTEEVKKKEFDFGKLEKRNKELNEKKPREVNSAVLQQLKNIIEYEESNPNKMEFKDLKLTGSGVSVPPADENDYLVKRPSKNFVWGLGQQTKQKKCKYSLI
jgi:hypothetical protein